MEQNKFKEKKGDYEDKEQTERIKENNGFVRNLLYQKRSLEIKLY